MPMTSPARLRAATITLLIAATTMLFAVGSPASAAPDDEGGTKALKDALASASRGHVEAQNALDNSKKRQQQLEEKLTQSETVLQSVTAQVGAVAAKSYRTGRASAMSLMLSAGSPDDFLETITRLDLMARYDSDKIKRWEKVKQETLDAKTAIDIEVNEQAKQENVMAKKLKEAEVALKGVGGGRSGGFINPNSPAAQPAPRNDDGSWPTEKCTIDDPTPAGGCITPRTLHAMNEAKAAGFTRYVYCHRSGGGGEHPLGRACDFSAAAGGFKDVAASGGDKEYGDNLASFFIKNASSLGVMYVIWYRQIWMPGRGWSNYTPQGGPAVVHTNHVHLSML